MVSDKRHQDSMGPQGIQKGCIRGQPGLAQRWFAPVRAAVEIRATGLEEAEPVGHVPIVAAQHGIVGRVNHFNTVQPLSHE